MRSLTCAAIVTVMSSLLCAPNAHGALTEFEFGGVFTRTTGTVHQVGAPFTTTVRFDLNAFDQAPSPLLGRYTYSSWTVPYRNATPIVVVPPGGAIEVSRDAGADSWSLRNNAPEFSFELVIVYPAGTFSSDALPNTLDLSGATTTSFTGFSSSFGVDLRGSVSSFRVVPEPATRACLSFAVLLLRRVR